MFSLQPLARGESPFVVIRNPYSIVEDRMAGQQGFRNECSECHGELTALTPRSGASDWALYRLIKHGIPDTPMIGTKTDPRTIWQIVGYLQELRGGGLADVTPVEATSLPPFVPATHERLLALGSAAADDWLTYSGSYRGWRHSSLAEIDTTNVAQLQLLWTYQTLSQAPFEVTPLVLGGWFFFTEPNSNRVIALDAENGREIWSYAPVLPDDLRLCCGAVNRGVGGTGELLFLGTLDARLIALEARTGRVRWERTVASYKEGYSITSAPLVVEDKVLVGIAGGEYGIRGFLDCYDALTGDHLWRFFTIPAPGEPGHETWSGDAWRTGGGPTWVTGSYDPELRVVYWGVGNPGPDYNAASRPGDNLYTNSIVALNVDSGKLIWHFQFTPHDEHDWDANHTPILVDGVLEGRQRRLVVMANKNAYYYVLDRVTGEFIRGVPFAWQTWSHGLDPHGRPIPREEAAPSRKGTLVAPVAAGATNWWPSSYDPSTGFVYVPSRDQAELFFTGNQDHRPGEMYLSGAARPTLGRRTKSVRALDALSGKQEWEYEFSEELGGTTYSLGGTLTTAGNLVFAGAGRELVALDAGSGDLLWRITTGSIKAGPITWASRGRQRISIAAGQSILTFGLR